MFWVALRLHYLCLGGVFLWMVTQILIQFFFPGLSFLSRFISLNTHVFIQYWWSLFALFCFMLELIFDPASNRYFHFPKFVRYEVSLIPHWWYFDGSLDSELHFRFHIHNHQIIFFSILSKYNTHFFSLEPCETLSRCMATIWLCIVLSCSSFNFIHFLFCFPFFQLIALTPQCFLRFHIIGSQMEFPCLYRICALFSILFHRGIPTPIVLWLCFDYWGRCCQWQQTTEQAGQANAKKRLCTGHCSCVLLMMRGYWGQSRQGQWLDGLAVTWVVSDWWVINWLTIRSLFVMVYS